MLRHEYRHAKVFITCRPVRDGGGTASANRQCSRYPTLQDTEPRTQRCHVNNVATGGHRWHEPKCAVMCEVAFVLNLYMYMSF